MRLHINIDHVATLRNQRDVDYPDPLEAARICMNAGADGITVHLREDRRHIRDADVDALREARLGLFNLEMAATSEMAQIASRVVPDVVTLVPEKREERTTEGGLDVLGAEDSIREVAQVCRAKGIKLSLFIEASPEQVRASARIGAAQVEFHTGHYCDAPVEERAALLEQLKQSAIIAHDQGLEVAAGHGLTRKNVGEILSIPHLKELNIGHSVVADAVLIGMEQAVRQLRLALTNQRGVGATSQPRSSENAALRAKVS